MKCIVPVKRVIDYNVKIRVKNDGSGVETNHVKMSMNPFDEVALEEAVKLKEANKISEIIAVSIGNKLSEETLRVAFARGADQAILIDTGTDNNTNNNTDTTTTSMPPEPLSIAKILKWIIEKEGITLGLLGKQAIDDDCNQTGQMLAGLLGWSQATNVSQLNLNMNDSVKDNVNSSINDTTNNTVINTIEATREIDGGLETVTLKMPAIITVDLRLNEPRYISLPNVMRAKNKPITTIKLTELKEKFGMDLKTHTQTLKVEPPSLHRTGVILNTVSELVDKLHHEAKVI